MAVASLLFGDRINFPDASLSCCYPLILAYEELIFDCYQFNVKMHFDLFHSLLPALLL